MFSNLLKIFLISSYSDWDEHPNPAHVEPEVRPEIPVPDARQPEVEVAAAGGLTTVSFHEILRF